MQGRGRGQGPSAVCRPSLPMLAPPLCADVMLLQLDGSALAQLAAERELGYMEAHQAAGAARVPTDFSTPLTAHHAHY